MNYLYPQSPSRQHSRTGRRHYIILHSIPCNCT
uniref:Uncharacterized protein n=1 Tax=Anguilla anguilla TaxID=7936 RepID=A0A0E9R4S8_ANGAN